MVEQSIFYIRRNKFNSDLHEKKLNILFLIDDLKKSLSTRLAENFTTTKLASIGLRSSRNDRWTVQSRCKKRRTGVRLSAPRPQAPRKRLPPCPRALPLRPLNPRFCRVRRSGRGTGSSHQMAWPPAWQHRELGHSAPSPGHGSVTGRLTHRTLFTLKNI